MHWSVRCQVICHDSLKIAKLLLQNKTKAKNVKNWTCFHVRTVSALKYVNFELRITFLHISISEFSCLRVHRLFTSSLLLQRCHFKVKISTDLGISFNPISGRLLATPISGRGLFRTPPLISRDLTGRFSKFKRHSIPLNVIYILKK